MYCRSMLRRRPRSRLFPYTTLFRSQRELEELIVVLDHGHQICESPVVVEPTLRMGHQTAKRGRAIALVGRSDGKSYRRSEEHTSELQSLRHLVCRLLLEKKNPRDASGQSQGTGGAARDSTHRGMTKGLARVVAAAWVALSASAMSAPAAATANPNALGSR